MEIFSKTLKNDFKVKDVNNNFVNNEKIEDCVEKIALEFLHVFL